MRLSHVALTVADKERSADFYGRYFGLTGRIEIDERLLILTDDAGSMLALSPGDVPAGLPRTNHFGFQVDDPQEVHDARARFRAAGIEEAEWQDSHGFVRVQVRDPDGYEVEIFAVAPPS